MELAWVWQQDISGIPSPPPQKTIRRRIICISRAGWECGTAPSRGEGGGEATRLSIIVHLLNRHIRDTVVILEEGKLPHPRCPHCYIMVPWAAMNGRHTTTDHCAKGVDRKQRRFAVEEMRAITARAFQAYG